MTDETTHETTHESTGESTDETGTDSDGLPFRPPMEDSPPIIDAHRTFLATLIGAALFIAAVVSFIL